MASTACFIVPASSRDPPSSSLYPTPARQSQSNPYAPSYAQQERHAVSLADVAKWRAAHPQDRLRPPVGGQQHAQADKATIQGFRPPQHPASHVLHSIPPRAASRSSRFNILSYTLHLATFSRLSSYNSPSGSRSLLYLAEAERDGHCGGDFSSSVSVDDAWFDAEQKTQGLWKLGANLLQSSRKEGGLPPSVERRVDLAGLTEDLLVAPSAERAVLKIDAESVQPSAEVEELVVLKPLTAPDPTTLYHTTSTAMSNASASGAGGAAEDGATRPRVHSVAQSLIDLKFGGKADPSEQVSPSLPDSKPLPSHPLDSLPSASSSSNAVAPHMDYRIVLGQSMRTRARSIFATSPLPGLTTSYCRSHRVEDCAVCAKIVEAAGERESNHARMRRKNVPGAGLRFVPASGSSSTMFGGAGGQAVAAPAGGKKPLVALLPDFIKLSAALLRDIKDRSTRLGNDQDLVDQLVQPSSPSEKGKEPESTPAAVELQVTAEWYDLLTSLLVQACLEGYLVDGWTGTEGVETLFGVGCGVWEGRGWSAKQPLPPSSYARPARRTPPTTTTSAGNSDAGVSEEGNEESEEEEEEDEEEQRKRVEEEERQRREEETRALVEAARALFGSRDVAQADYERGLRDRTHEFLNVPQDRSFHEHLAYLSAKYPLSQLEDAMVDFIEAANRLLGKPALAKYDPRTSSSSSSSHATPLTPSSSASTHSPHDPTADPFALIRYFAPSSFASTAPLLPASIVKHESDDERSRSRSRGGEGRRPYRPWEDQPENKRRRIE
ncbi:hypothetical protein JCM8547_000282 [Rhodosporidiobolus lusitaniae]